VKVVCSSEMSGTVVGHNLGYYFICNYIDRKPRLYASSVSDSIAIRLCELEHSQQINTKNSAMFIVVIE
jgi:hypothetical protein